MSDDTGFPRPAASVRTDYTTPIARAGEQQFACILRNRSGIDSGRIDFGARFIDELCETDQRDAVNMAYAVYAKWRDETGFRANRDPAPAPTTADAGVTEAMVETFEAKFLECARTRPDSTLRDDIRAALVAALGARKGE